MSRRGTADAVLLRRVLSIARPYRSLLAALLLLDLLATPIALLAPLPLLIVVDFALGGRPLPALAAGLLPASLAAGAGLVWVAAGLVVALAALAQIQDLASSYLHGLTGERLVLELRAQMFRHVQRLSVAFHDARGPSHSLYRIQWDAPAVQHVAVDGLLPFAGAALTLAGMITVTFRIDPALALVALAISPLLYLVTRLWRRPLRHRYERVKDLEDRALAVVHEVLGALRVVKAFSKEEHEERRFVRQSRAGTEARLSLLLFQGGFDLVLGLLLALGTAAVLVVGARRVGAGAITLGELLVVMTYLAQLYVPLRTLSNKLADVQASLASAERAFALLDEAPDVPERKDARRLERARGEIALEGVHFAYAAGRPVLSDVSLDLPAGSRVGLVGRTGAGKTTLVSLLVRFYDPTRGCIRLDGVDLRDFRLDDLRRQFSLVLQEPLLLSASIRENIAYARPEAGLEEVVAAARAAHAHEFIAQLERGYDSEVGERGLLLSGGERQRIAIARAFLRDAPVLILDEPTSAVDLRTEADILAALERLMAGRTTIVIAHRASTLARCDVVLELAGGQARPAPSIEVV